MEPAGDGLHAVTMRAVAAEAGVSLRLVQYYFQTKEKLLHDTLERLAHRMAARVQARLSAAAHPKEVIAAVLAEALPTDHESRAFHHVWTAYAVLSITDRDLAAQPFLNAPNTMETFVARQLETAAVAHAGVEAAGLLAMSAGLGTSVLLGQRTADTAAAVLRHHVDRLMPT